MDNVELEGRPRQPLMLEEWLELEYSAELSRDGFGCYPRHLAPEPRSAAGCRRRRNGDVIARVSAAVRAALSRPPSARQGEAAALPRSLSTRLRVVGFWKKRRRGEMEETDRPVAVASCSATAASSGTGRRDGASSLATSPRHMGRRESRQAGGDRVGLSGCRRSHETVAEGCECEATTCHLDDEEREQEQRLSPVSVMDFQSQDGDDDCNENGGCNGDSDDEGASPTFERSLANIRRASQQLQQRIRRFELLAELDTSDIDSAATTADDTSCQVRELDTSVEDDEDAECAPVRQDMPGQLPVPEAGSPCPAHCVKKLLEDFFREGLSPCHAVGSDDSELEMSLLETAKAWLDGRHGGLRPDQKAEVEEIERRGRWRCFREDERELLSSDVEGGIFCYLMEELVEDLC